MGNHLILCLHPSKRVLAASWVAGVLCCGGRNMAGKVRGGGIKWSKGLWGLGLWKYLNRELALEVLGVGTGGMWYESNGEEKNNFKKHGSRLWLWSSFKFFKRFITGIRPSCSLQPECVCLCATLRLEVCAVHRRKRVVCGHEGEERVDWACGERQNETAWAVEKPRDGAGSPPTGFVCWHADFMEQVF